MQLKVSEAKNNFFDRAAVIKRLEAARRRNLSKLGAFIRTRAITLLLRHKINKKFGVHSRVTNRHAGETAPAGQPPYAHTGNIAKFMFFGYDAENDSVVIGPALLSGVHNALKELEEGGTAMLPIGKGFGRNRKKILRRVTFAPHPFMAPALAAEKAKSAKLWENTIR